MSRYKNARLIAKCLRVLGWLLAAVTFAFLLLGLVLRLPIFMTLGPVILFPYMIASLLIVLIAEVSLAIFDIADSQTAAGG